MIPLYQVLPVKNAQAGVSGIISIIPGPGLSSTTSSLDPAGFVWSAGARVSGPTMMPVKRYSRIEVPFHDRQADPWLFYETFIYSYLVPLSTMGGEVFQAQVIRNFFDTITGTDRNLTRIYLCVISLAKLRMENPEKISFLVDQIRKSKQQRELSVDILDYMCDAAIQLDQTTVQTAFGVKTFGEVMQDFNGISLDTL